MGRLVHLGHSKVEDNMRCSWLTYFSRPAKVECHVGMKCIRNMSKVFKNEYNETKRITQNKAWAWAVTKANTSLQPEDVTLEGKIRRKVIQSVYYCPLIKITA